MDTSQNGDKRGIMMNRKEVARMSPIKTQTVVNYHKQKK